MVIEDGTAIAVAQFAPTDDAAANRDAVADLARVAAARGAQLVVFPEYSSFFIPELGQASIDAAEQLDGAFVTSLASVAAELGIHIVAGMLERADTNRAFNTAVAVAP